MRLQGKVALITGAASGFGEGIARLFAAEGASVVVVDRAREAGLGVAAEIAEQGGEAHFVEADVGEREGSRAMIAAAVERFGGLDILVNNAGVSHANKPFEEVSEAEFDHIYRVNVKAVYLAIQAALPAFRQRGGGAVINTSSTAAMRPRPGLTVYNSSKGAVQVLTKSLAVELAPDKVRVNALCPVIGETGLLETFMGVPDTPENREKFLATIPLGRFSTPRDIAGAALFLAGDEAAFITGVALEVDGGRSV
jgi:3-oxoacyl-[acyl-carrier protein] reductase